jgi:hypothetical protein
VTSTDARGPVDTCDDDRWWTVACDDDGNGDDSHDEDDSMNYALTLSIAWMRVQGVSVLPWRHDRVSSYV